VFHFGHYCELSATITTRNIVHIQNGISKRRGGRLSKILLTDVEMMELKAKSGGH